MTKKELSQLHYLNKEIEKQEKKLYELETFATSTNTTITGIPKSQKFINNVEKYAIEIADLKTSIEKNIKKCFEELNKINSFIMTIENSEMRMIFSLRYIDCLSWKQIAIKLGDPDESTFRKKHNIFLKNF